MYTHKVGAEKTMSNPREYEDTHRFGEDVEKAWQPREAQK
jgi:hypothetical protein